MRISWILTVKDNYPILELPPSSYYQPHQKYSLATPQHIVYTGSRPKSVTIAMYGNNIKPIFLKYHNAH